MKRKQFAANLLPYHVRVQRYNEEKHELLYNSRNLSPEQFEAKLKELVKKWRI